MTATDNNRSSTVGSPGPLIEQPRPQIAALRGWPRAVVRWLILTLIRPVIALTIEDLDRVPEDGAFLLVANHLHNADPVLIMAALHRPVHFMAKQELFREPILALILRLVGAFSVDRDRPGRAAIRQAEVLLANDIPVGMFPEGTRSRTGLLGPAFAGAGLIAARSRQPIIPVAIWGTERLPGGAGAKSLAPGRRWPRSRYPVEIRFGEAFTLPPEVFDQRRPAIAATSMIMEKIASMLPDDYYRPYAPVPEDQAETT
jgi:1-acyl-sn-glycerol-3-phosphate acyltransferase